MFPRESHVCASQLFNLKQNKKLIDNARGKTALSFYCFSIKLLSHEEVIKEYVAKYV